MRNVLLPLLAVLTAGLAGLNVYQYGRHKTATVEWVERVQEAQRAHRPGGVQTTQAPPAAPSPEQVITQFYDLWMPLQQPTVWQNKWFGVSTLQNPMDLWITQEVMVEVRPDFIVEAGTYHGGSAAAFAMILEHINPNGRIITIDIEDMAQDAKKLPIVQRRVDFILGSSTDPKVLADIKERVKGKTVMVILDSLHTKAHVLDELNAYAPIVSVGSYLIVQDTFVNGHPTMRDYGPGPWEAVPEFRKTNHDYEIDKNRERLMFTFSPDGWLKRIR